MIDSTTASLRRKIRRTRSHDDDNDLKTKCRGSWRNPCIVLHQNNDKSSRKALLLEQTDCSESETEPENDVYYSSDDGSDAPFICPEHRGIFNAVHVRRSHFLKPSSGDVEIVPMPSASMGHGIEFESSSTTCSEQLEEERAPPDIDGCVSSSSFTWFRINYVLVMSAIMLADGLQGRCQ